MSNIQIEVSPWMGGHPFFRAGLRLVEAEGLELLRRFFPEAVFQEGPRDPQTRVDQYLLERWKLFLKQEKTTSRLENTSVEAVEAFVQHVLDEAANSEDEARGSLSRSQDSGKRWRAMKGQSPVVVTDSAVCYGCGKVHDHPIGRHLEIGPYDIPCCPGRSDSGLKKSCRLEAIERLSCCPSCGRLGTKLGKVCTTCSELVEAGRKAKATAGVSVVLSLSSKGVSHRVEVAVRDVLVSLGAKDLGSGGKVKLPELTVPEVEALLQVVSSEVEGALKKGLERGSSLLHGLADGTVSVAEFNQKAGRAS